MAKLPFSTPSANGGSGSIPVLSTASLAVPQFGESGRWRGGQMVEVRDEILLETTASGPVNVSAGALLRELPDYVEYCGDPELDDTWTTVEYQFR